MTENQTSSLKIEEIRTSDNDNADQVERHVWTSYDEGYPGTSYDSTTSRYRFTDHPNRRYRLIPYNLYDNTVLNSDFIDSQDIHTHSSDETNEYLSRSTVDIYKDTNPQIIRRAAIEGPLTYEQQIHVRYLQPPAVPPPGPVIIKEVRPPQPPPPQALVIHEQPHRPPTPPPLVLRERPPTPPPHIPSETIIRNLPALPVPPRSVIIRRFPALPEKPRDIFIERWLPYGPQPERQTIVQRAAAAQTYADPYNQIIIYEPFEARVVRRFEKFSVTMANPADYVARYGSSLLDAETLVQRARTAGVYEDLSVPAVTSTSGYTRIEGGTRYYDRATDKYERHIHTNIRDGSHLKYDYE